MDAVLDTVGEATWDFSLRALRPGGTVVVSGATSGPNPPAQLNRIFWRQLTVAGSSMGTRDELRPRASSCARPGELRPLVDSVRPLAEAAEAFAALAAGERRGKLVLPPAPRPEPVLQARAARGCMRPRCAARRRPAAAASGPSQRRAVHPTALYAAVNERLSAAWL